MTISKIKFQKFWNSILGNLQNTRCFDNFKNKVPKILELYFGNPENTRGFDNFKNKVPKILELYFGEPPKHERVLTISKIKFQNIWSFILETSRTRGFAASEGSKVFNEFVFYLNRISDWFGSGFGILAFLRWCSGRKIVRFREMQDSVSLRVIGPMP